MAPVDLSPRVPLRGASWAGLALAGLGWLVLAAGESTLAVLGLGSDQARLSALAQMLVITGFGLAVLDVLHAGFGALNRFFEAVLQRSAAKAPSEPAPRSVRPGPAGAGDIVERGRLNGRAFLRDRDGTVDVETLLGVRRFASLEDAEDFIGA